MRITVGGSGPGSPPIDRLGAERSEVQGTGLGLALSKQLAATMGGSLTA